MANPRQMGLFDGHHPKSTHISIKEKHELVQLTDLTPWPELIEAAMDRIDGFVLGFLINGGVNASDQKFCMQSIKEHIELFGKAPKTYGFDRGGYSKANIKRAKKLGVKNVGIAPTGKAKWSVSEKMSEAIRRERAQVEGVIGSVKSKKYGFNKPNVKSTVAMEMSGHRSCLGFNLCKALRKLNEQQLQMA